MDSRLTILRLATTIRNQRESGEISITGAKLYWRRQPNTMQMAAIPRIPDWDPRGLIPPIDPDNPASVTRSPYIASLSELITRFGTTAERLQLLDGLLRYRAEWLQAELSLGFQWINGSFVEDKERNTGSGPADIDVVTFFAVPQGYTQETLEASYRPLFDQVRVKREFHVDAYFVGLTGVSPLYLVAQSTYWSSLFSHSRENLWKGYVQIDLADQADANLRRNIGLELNRTGQHEH